MPDEPVSVACPHCSARLKLKDASSLGKTIKCPKCAQSFVAQPVGAAAAAASAGAPARKKRPAPEAAPPDDDEDDDVPDEPKKKKKKRKKKKESGVSLPLILSISAFVFLLVAGGVVALIIVNKGSGGSRAAAVAAPELVEWTGPAYSLLAPKQNGEEWKPDAGGAANYEYVGFVSGGVRIRVQNDSAGVGDITSMGGRGEKFEDKTMEVIHRVHMGKKESLAEDFGDYKEEAPVPFDCKFGSGRYSEFSGTEGSVFKSKIRGIRVTIQNNTKTLTLRCICPESQWETFKPIFIKVLTSVSPGRRA